MPFREPLLPTPLPSRAAALKLVARGDGLQLAVGELRVTSDRLDGLIERIRAVQRGLIVCGPSSRPRAAREAIGGLASRLAWPILADPLSGLRSGEAFDRLVIEPHDVVLRSERYRETQRPDLVLRFGSLPTSKTLQRALEAWRCDQVLFTTPSEWPDPQWTATTVVVCDPIAAARDLVARLGGASTTVTTPAAVAWREAWRSGARVAREVLDSALADVPATFEGRAARDLARALPGGAVLVVGNSMPIRDVDVFCWSIRPDLTVLGNRGANGIDGLLSTALGAAASSGAPTALLLGDLSFLHDVGALQLAAKHRLPLLVVIVDNDGGGIFHTPVRGARRDVRALLCHAAWARAARRRATPAGSIPRASG
jgi:2-succinyl-5-enolpyruvyl-6-hydroxy-3-cyclohexene-1-carboxylate synthase